MSVCANDLREVAKFLKAESGWPVSMAVCDRAADHVDFLHDRIDRLESALSESVTRFQQISCAMSNHIHSDRAFNKYGAIAERGEAICVAAIGTD